MRIALEPPPGLTDDDTTFASPGAWGDGNNVRFVKGRPQTIGGWLETQWGSLTGVCRNIKIWTDKSGNPLRAFGTHSKLYVRSGTVIYDITPSGLQAGLADTVSSAPGYGMGTYGSGYYSMSANQMHARTWSLDTWGQNLIACPRGGTLYRWQNDTAVIAAAVANAPDEITAILTTPERQVLALGCNEEVSGLFNPLCIRGCDLEDIDDWTTASTNNAFEHILEGAGQIVTARMVGPYVAVWSNTGVYLGQYIGAPGQTYRFDLVAVSCGLIGPNAVYVRGQTAFWIGTDNQLRMWTPGGQPQIVPCPIWHDFSDNLDTNQTDKIVVTEIFQFGELWIFYPDTRDALGDAENSRYVTYAIDDQTWFRGDVARTAFVDGSPLAVSTVAGTIPIGVDENGVIYFHESGSFEGSGADWFIQTADTYVGEGEQVVEIQRFIPDFEDQAQSVTLTVYARKLPRSTPSSTSQTITTSSTRKDFRISGRIMAVKLNGTGGMRLGKPLFEAVSRGLR